MEKFNAVLIGTGNMGKVHLQSALDSPYINELFLCDLSAEVLKSRCQEYNCRSISFEQALADETIKMAIIATPNSLHAEQTLQCLQAHKAVLCEKPMGMTLTEAQKVVKASQQPGAFLQIGFELHYSNMFDRRSHPDPVPLLLLRIPQEKHMAEQQYRQFSYRRKVVALSGSAKVVHRG